MLSKNRISFGLNLALVIVLLSGLMVLPSVDLVRAAVNCPSTDQRGIAPLQGAHCDIGAYEKTIHYVKWNATGANNGTSWTDAYTDLQSALSTAMDGDEIWVATGTYYPTAGTDRTISFTLKNGVALYGGFVGNETLLTQRNPSTTIAILSGNIGSATDSDNSYHVVVGSNTNSSAVLDGFLIRRGFADGSSPHDKGGGMYTSNGNPSLRNVVFDTNLASFGGGMANENSSPSLTDVIFHNNSANNMGGGMYIQDGSPALRNASFINRNGAPTGGGIANVNGNPILENVTFNWNLAKMAPE